MALDQDQDCWLRILYYDWQGKVGHLGDCCFHIPFIYNIVYKNWSFCLIDTDNQALLLS
jgi:hypothetical protein